MQKLSIDKRLYLTLKKIKNFEPSKKINKIFFELVEYAIERKNSLNLNQKELSEIQKICSKAEGQMEKFWAKKIIKSSDPEKVLESFWYYKNYLDLTTLEWSSLKSCGLTNHKHNNILFVGSGALPLTAILLVKLFNLKVTLVDNDSGALKISRKLISRIGLLENFKFLEKNIEDFKNLKNFDVVFLAALVGGDSKESVTNELFKKLKLGAHLLCRSSYDNRVLLYKPINLEKLNFEVIKEVRTYDEVVNSVLISKK